MINWTSTAIFITIFSKIQFVRKTYTGPGEQLSYSFHAVVEISNPLSTKHENSRL